MILIDASAFLAYYNTRDLHHSKSVELFENLQDGKYGKYFTSDYIFNEVVGVTLRKQGKEAAKALGATILRSMSIVNVDEHLLGKAWRLFCKTGLNLGLVDCTSLVVMDLANSGKIATFDKEFSKVKEIEVVN